MMNNNFLEWNNINEKLPPKHELVLTINSNGFISLSRYVSNDFPLGNILWAQIPLPNKENKNHEETN